MNEETLQPASGTILKKFDEKTIRYIVSLLNEGKDTQFIVSNLVENGYGQQESYIITTAIEKERIKAYAVKEKKSAPLDLILGIIILIAGIAITASGAGIIAYGAIIVGIIKTIRGLSNLA